MGKLSKNSIMPTLCSPSVSLTESFTISQTSPKPSAPSSLERYFATSGLMLLTLVHSLIRCVRRLGFRLKQSLLKRWLRLQLTFKHLPRCPFSLHVSQSRLSLCNSSLGRRLKLSRLRSSEGFGLEGCRRCFLALPLRLLLLFLRFRLGYSDKGDCSLVQVNAFHFPAYVYPCSSLSAAAAVSPPLNVSQCTER